MISPQTKAHSQKFKDEKGLTMEILSDPGNSVGEKYGLIYTFTEELKQAYLELGINLKEYNGCGSFANDYHSNDSRHLD